MLDNLMEQILLAFEIVVYHRNGAVSLAGYGPDGGAMIPIAIEVLHSDLLYDKLQVLVCHRSFLFI
jgi:hypothetical protein